MNPPRLQLHGIRKAFGETRVLDGIDLNVREGEFVSVLGPSGAGKSTILQLLIGGILPDAGSIRFDGAPLRAGEGHFAFMPQRDALMPWRRIMDNATLGLEVQGMKRSQARARVTPLLAEFGLAGFEHHYPAQLSGGMRQRAALLRTVVQERDMLLLDEPFGALDALTRTGMQRWLETMWKHHRWTALLITHDVREAVFLSDRIYILSARPARVLHEFHVPLPRPRDAGASGIEEAGRIEAAILETLLTPDTAEGGHP
jgi:ABC-type nitrate/sulfonate/bicarbonate transport system ATPase subunit